MNKTILITGASTGIGRATAIYFQEKGWNVVATMRTPENESELNKLNNVMVEKLDVQNISSIESAIANGIERFGKIDVLLNNAGYGLMGSFESISRESIQRQYAVNVFGLFDVTRALIPHFRKNRSGVIINVSSVGGRITMPVTSIYHSTKFAVEGFSESLQYELEPFGIQVKIVEPGAIATDFGSRSLDFQHDPSLTDYNTYIEKIMNVFNTMMDPQNMSTSESVAEVVYEAATENSDQMRYLAGPDAEQWISARAQMDDVQFRNMIKSQMQLN